MKRVPWFRVEESWDKSGDIDIWMDNNVTCSLRDCVGDQLEKYLSQLKKDERTVFHVERVVSGIFKKMKKDGKLAVQDKKWVVRGK